MNHKANHIYIGHDIIRHWTTHSLHATSCFFVFTIANNINKYVILSHLHFLQAFLGWFSSIVYNSFCLYFLLFTHVLIFFFFFCRIWAQLTLILFKLAWCCHLVIYVMYISLFFSFISYCIVLRIYDYFFHGNDKKMIEEASILSFVASLMLEKHMKIGISCKYICLWSKY